MSWNYRVVRVDGELRIYDVYYDDAGNPQGRGELPSHVYGDSLDDLGDHLDLFLAALENPVLDDVGIGSPDSESTPPASGQDA